MRSRTLSRIRSLFFVALFLVPVFGAQCQTADQSASQSKSAGTEARPSTIVRDVDEVSLDLVVNNKKNRAVLDLKPGDITVTDNGSPAEISDLRLVAGTTSDTDHLVVFLFDQLSPSAAGNARRIAHKTLKMLPEKGFRVAILNVNGRLRMLQEFTSDRQELTSAINLATDESDLARNNASVSAEKKLIATAQSGIDQSGTALSVHERDIQRVMLGSLRESSRIISEQNAPPALAGLLALTRLEAGITGRKVVVFFTQGLEVNPDTGDFVRSIVGVANRGGVSIYAINTNGIDPREFQSLTETVAIGNMMTNNNLNPAPTAATLTTSEPLPAAWIGNAVGIQLNRFETEGMAGYKEPLAALAGGTGGTYVGADGNFKKPMRQMIADLSTYYVLSYTPHIQRYDGQFHNVSVKTARSGLKIHTGAGYYAVPPSEESGLLGFEAPLLKLLEKPELPTDVKLRSRVLQLGKFSDEDEGANALVIEVPLSELESREDPNTNLLSWHVLILSQIKNKAGAVVQQFGEDIPRRVALDTKETARSECATMQRHFVAPPGEYILETAVIDRNSGKMGAERRNFEIKNPAAGPFLSDVSLVKEVEPFRDGVDPFEPLRYGNGKVVPSLSNQITRGRKELSFFFLVHPHSSASAPAMIETQILRNGELVTQMPLQVPDQGGDVFPYLASIRTASLPAGNYDLNVILTQSGKIIQRGTSFAIAGSELASNIAGGKPGPDKSAADLEAVSDSQLEALPQKDEHLSIVPISPESVSRPTVAQTERIIAGARQHALNYSAKLPNFFCVEATDRSIDPSGRGKWRRKDSFAELVRYRDNQESRTMLEVNAQRSDMTRADMTGPISLGEFGDVLNAIFQPASKADFRWKETDALGNGTVQVFDYRVARENASMTLTDSNGKFYAGFHGLIYVDSSTYGIRRISMEADGLPSDSSIHAASITVDYDYVAIGAHEYLMPVRGTISLRRGRHEADLNQVVFQGYRRYASQAKMVTTP